MNCLSKNIESQHHIAHSEIHRLTCCSSLFTHKVPLAYNVTIHKTSKTILKEKPRGIRA